MTTIQQTLVALARSQGELTAAQEVALARFCELGLPRYKSENYQRTDLAAMLEGPWVKVEPSCSCSPAQAESYFALLDEHHAIPEITSTEHGSLVQLSRMLTPASGYLRIPKGAKLHFPIEVSSELQAREERSLASGRLVIVVEDEAEVELVLRDRNLSEVECLSLQCYEVHVGRGAKLRLTDIETSSSQARRICTLHLHQEAESEVYINSFALTGGKTRNNFHCDLRGQGAHLELGGLVISSGDEHVDNFSYIAHSVPHCTSDEMFKYVLQDRSYGVFTGRILVAVDAQKTQAYQNNRNLLLSPEARMQAKPQLEIYADDVKCSHGMTTGQIDEDALFYMRQRGIAEAEARRMLSVAFAEDVLQRIERPELRDQLRAEVEERFKIG